MNIIAAALSLALVSPSWSQTHPKTAPEVPLSTATETELAPLVVTVPWLTPEETKRLERARDIGGLAATSGAGVILYAVVIASAGPIAWASCLVFIGGLTAYLSHRRLQGHEDFNSSREGPADRAQNGADAGKNVASPTLGHLPPENSSAR